MFKIIFFLWLCMFQAIAHSQINLENTPDWVNSSLTYKELGTQPESSGYNLLLFDRQLRLSNKEQYTHFAYELLTPDGIQENSPITVNYDPTYQQVVFHQVDIIRKGQRIDRMNKNYFNEINREENLERHQYNGRRTVVVNLPDIRIGDILEYAYSINGSNPFFSELSYGEHYMEWGLPIEKLFFKITYPTNLPLHWDIDDSLSSFQEKVVGDETERIWQKESVKALNFENNVPSWYDPRARISYSSLEEWKILASFINRQYKISEHEKIEIRNQLSKLNFNGNSKEELRKLIRFVQDDIRYLGFEDGISAYKPHSPVKVLKQRYGDCKDKSLLLVEMMKALGVKAQALLVSTTRGKILSDLEVSPTVFDHCVMRFEHEDDWIYIDPTINGQAGSIEDIYFPPYQSALIIDQEGELIDLDEQVQSTMVINEEIGMDSIGGGIRYDVKTTYSGSQSDTQKDIFSSSEHSEIQQNYLDWYKNVYPYIRINDSLTFKNYPDDGQSKFETYESYIVDSAWINGGDGFLYLEIYQLALEQLVNFDRKTDRRMPLYVGRESFEQTVKINLPEKWNAGDESYEIKGDGYQMSFKSKYSSISDILTLHYTYRRDSTTISADKVDSFTKDHKAMMDKLAYTLNYNLDYRNTGINWLTLFLTLIIIAFLSYLLRKLHQQYNPNNTLKSTLPISIGSWLIIPLIGLIITFIQTCYLIIIDFHLLEKGYWIAIWDLEYAGIALVISEFIYNIFTICFSVLLIIQFIKRRTSLPKLIIAFYAMGVLIPWLDTIIASNIYETQTGQVEMKGIIQSAISASIWIPIFLMSKRVSNTFVKRLDESETTKLKNIESKELLDL